MEMNKEGGDIGRYTDVKVILVMIPIKCETAIFFPDQSRDILLKRLRVAMRLSISPL